MVKRERKFYSEEFKEQVLTAYQNSNESVSMVAGRFQVSRDTVGSWVYRKRRVAESKKRVKLWPSGMERQTVHEMRQESSSYGMDALCRLFGKSRQAYYERASYAAATRAEEDTILSPVREVRKDFPRMGARKLLIFLRPKLEAMHLHIGRDAFIELPYRNFMPVRKVKNRRKTTFSNHRMHKYPNLRAGYTPSAPNRLWVSDITYIETGSDVSYLFLITDAYSHKIIGWKLSRTLRTSGSPAALKMALGSLKGEQPELIHHSDRGSQYCAVGIMSACFIAKASVSA